MYDESHKNIMTSQFGGRKGSLWRSERDWFALTADKPDLVLKEAAEYVKERRKGLLDEKGFSGTRKHRYMGSIPFEVAISNPELLYDPLAARKFFKDFPDFSSKGR